MARYQRDLPRIRSLGAKAAQLDALFLHRIARLCEKGRHGAPTWASALKFPTSCRARPCAWWSTRTLGVWWVWRMPLASVWVQPPCWPTSTVPGASQSRWPILRVPYAMAPTWWRWPMCNITAWLSLRGSWAADMDLRHFGLRHPPLGKTLTEPWDDGALAQLGQRLNWLPQSPGIGLLTGEPGVGKTAALRSLTHSPQPAPLRGAVPGRHRLRAR